MGRSAAWSAAIAAVGLSVGVAHAIPPPPTVLHISSHLAKPAKASLDGSLAFTAPGYGSTNVPVSAGRHGLKVTTAAGVTYTTTLNLDLARLMRWRGHGYWCVNLLERSLQVYSTEDCQEEVTDAG